MAALLLGAGHDAKQEGKGTETDRVCIEPHSNLFSLTTGKGEVTHRHSGSADEKTDASVIEGDKKLVEELALGAEGVVDGR